MRPPARLLQGALLVVWATTAWPVSAQTSDELATLTKEVRELRELQESLQRDVQEIKRLLQERPKPSPEAPREVTVTVGGAPFRGDPDAPVTVVEFSDYQWPDAVDAGRSRCYAARGGVPSLVGQGAGPRA